MAARGALHLLLMYSFSEHNTAIQPVYKFNHHMCVTATTEINDLKPPRLYRACMGFFYQIFIHPLATTALLFISVPHIGAAL